VTFRQAFPVSLGPDKAIIDANDEGLLRRLVVALAPAPGIEPE
jgi:hypothetical protein